MAEQQQTEAERLKFEEKYKKELSVGTYAKKQILDLVISLGSMIGGMVIGYKVSKDEDISFKNPFADQLELDETVNTNKKMIGATIGALVGSLTAGIILGYSRWKKQESERLAVAEINEDVANMKIRQRTDPELLKENDRLREMLEVEEQKTTALQENKSPAQKLIEKGAKTPIEHSQTTETAGLQV